MQNTPVLDFFLGALSPSGFSGWFAQAATEPGAKPRLIKAGPGCGKSTFMRRMGEKGAQTAPDGAVIEQIHCSSDPDSLDGVRLPDGTLYLDATAPHTLDCKYPGAAEQVVSFYDTLDNRYLREHGAEILALGGQNAELLQRAAADFALACGLLQRRRQYAAQALDTEKLDRFTVRLAARTMSRRRGRQLGAQRIRLLSAPTPGGITVFADTVTKVATTIYVVHDAYGAASARMMKQLTDRARQAGYEAYVCRCASDQRRIDHLLLPELGVAFLTSNSWHPMNFPGQKNIHAARFMDGRMLKSRRGPLQYQKRIAAQLIARTCQTQAEAKRIHDELEKHYIHATDFAAVDAILARQQAELFDGK